MYLLVCKFYNCVQISNVYKFLQLSQFFVKVVYLHFLYFVTVYNFLTIASLGYRIFLSGQLLGCMCISRVTKILLSTNWEGRKIVIRASH